MEGIYETFPHNPPHFFAADANYMITTATYQKQPHLSRDDRKMQLLESFEFVLSRGGWKLIACVILSNH